MVLAGSTTLGRSLMNVMNMECNEHGTRRCFADVTNRGWITSAKQVTCLRVVFK